MALFGFLSKSTSFHGRREETLLFEIEHEHLLLFFIFTSSMSDPKILLHKWVLLVAFHQENELFTDYMHVRTKWLLHATISVLHHVVVRKCFLDPCYLLSDIFMLSAFVYKLNCGAKIITVVWFFRTKVVAQTSMHMKMWRTNDICTYKTRTWMTNIFGIKVIFNCLLYILIICDAKALL